MNLFRRGKKTVNPMDDLVENLCNGAKLYRKVAFCSRDELIRELLLSLADYRESILAQIRPYASIHEMSWATKQHQETKQNQKVYSMLEELEDDQDLFIVKQIEAETLTAFGLAQNGVENNLVKYLLQDLAKKFEVQLDHLTLLPGTNETGEKVA